MPTPFIDVLQTCSTPTLLRHHSVQSSPYQKPKDDNRNVMKFDGSFWLDSKHSASHPMVESFQNDRIRTRINWTSKYREELTRINVPQNETSLEVFESIMGFLSDSNATKVGIDSTPENSLLFRAVVNGSNLYLEIFFDNEEPEGYEAVLNEYGNGSDSATYVGTIQFVVNSFKTVTL